MLGEPGDVAVGGVDVVELVEGRVEEARRLLTRLLTRRFPTISAELIGRIEGATLEVVERWVDRFAVATTLDEVFD